METLDGQWVNLQSIIANLNSYSQTIFAGLNLGNSYSVGLVVDPYPPVNPLYARYFGSISTSYLNFAQLFNLTTGITQVEVNTSAISEDVWSENQSKYIYGTIIP